MWKGDPSRRHQGCVARIEPNRFGFVRVDGAQLFFHHSQASSLVRQHDRVTFRIEVDPHDPAKCGAVDVQLS